VSVSFDGSSSLICLRSRCFSGCKKLERFEFEKCPNLRYIHEEAFCGTALANPKLHPKFEFVSESAFDKECEITVIDDLEDTPLSEWAKKRDGDFQGRSECNFYLGSDFVQTELLGSGSFGKVYLFENRFTGERFAVKEMNEGLTKQEQFVREIELMKSLTHPCIVALRGFQLSPVMSMCMEYVSGGTLEDALSSSPSWFDPTSKLIIVIGIASAMSHIHSQNVIHLDLKPSNILLDESGEAKISDFGTARFDSNTCSMNLGTPLYMAPEIFRGDKYITRKVDIFSFGLILYQIIECVSVSSLKERYPDVSFSPRTNKEARSIIEACLDPDPEKRPEFSEILEEITNFELELIEEADTEKAREYFEGLMSLQDTWSK
jgi:serine/threonine protein kinase